MQYVLKNVEFFTRDLGHRNSYSPANRLLNDNKRQNWLAFLTAKDRLDVSKNIRITKSDVLNNTQPGQRSALVFFLSENFNNSVASPHFLRWTTIPGVLSSYKFNGQPIVHMLCNDYTFLDYHMKHSTGYARAAMEFAGTSTSLTNEFKMIHNPNTHWDGQFGETPLFGCRSAQCIRLLLRLGQYSRSDLELKNPAGKTFLQEILAANGPDAEKLQIVDSVVHFIEETYMSFHDIYSHFRPLATETQSTPAETIPAWTIKFLTSARSVLPAGNNIRKHIDAKIVSLKR